MPLNLVYGPPNSGRAGLIRAGFMDMLEHDPVLVVPNLDDVYDFEREICAGGASLGGSVMSIEALFGTIATAAGSPPGAVLTPTQRSRAISIAVEKAGAELGPLRRSAPRPGFVAAFERLLDELQATGVGPEDAAAAAGGSAYLADVATLFAGYSKVRDDFGRRDVHGVAREAIASLRHSAEFWNNRPVFLYGFDDLTRNQFDLIAALADACEVTVAVPYEERTALATRVDLLERLRQGIGVGKETQTEADPENTSNPLLFHIERGFGEIDAEPGPLGEGLTLLRSAGERSEAEAIGAEVAKLLARGVDPSEIAIAVPDPARRGPLLASVLESYGAAVALEAEIAIGGTAVGGALLALLEAEFGTGRASDLLRWLRGPSGVPPEDVDWLERSVRRSRTQTAAGARKLLEGRQGKSDPTSPLHPPSTPREVAEAARLMASRTKGGLELRAGSAIADAMAELTEIDDPTPTSLIHALREIRLRAWRGPTEGRVRIASPYRLRAGRFDHVFVASLQDGEFPRREGSDDPFLSDRGREALGLDPRRDTEAEERYLFYICLSLPRERLFLSWRDSDDAGNAEARSPFLDEVRRLISPPPGEDADPVEESITLGRDPAQVVQPLAAAPSEDELARSIAVHCRGGDPGPLLDAAGVGNAVSGRIATRLATATAAAVAGHAPGPLVNPAVTASLAAVSAYGGTTLEGFDVCSYRWFVDHELDPQTLDPVPEPLTQGGLMHGALERLYRERPEGDPLPRPASLGVWIEAGRRLVAEIAAERELGDHPVDRAIERRVDRLLTRFLVEEAARDLGGFEPWLLEAKFGEQEDSERPVLDLGGWGLHGAIDRVDRAPDGRALAIDYKLSSSVTPREKLEEKAKLQLQLYLLAVAEHWGGDPVGGLYHPLKGTSSRRPRGLVLDEAAGDLAAYGLYRGDTVDREGFEELLAEARERAGAIVTRMRTGDIDRDPGPREPLRGHDVCPTYCHFAPICRRDRAPVVEDEGEDEEQ